MALESRRLLMDDFDVYSKGLLVALDREKLREAKEYLPKIQNNLTSIGAYLDSHISLEENQNGSASAEEAASNDAERAVLAAKIAHEKAERLAKAQNETKQESERLKKAAANARKEASRASRAAKKAEKAETKAQKEAKHAAEHAGKANQAARRS